MWYNFNCAWIIFRWKIWRRKERTSVMKNRKYCSIIFRKPYATKYIPLKDLHCTKKFQVFILTCVNWLSKNCFVKVKINLDIVLSDITFDNGVVKKMSSILPYRFQRNYYAVIWSQTRHPTHLLEWLQIFPPLNKKSKF